MNANQPNRRTVIAGAAGLAALAVTPVSAQDRETTRRMMSDLRVAPERIELERGVVAISDPEVAKALRSDDAAVLDLLKENGASRSLSLQDISVDSRGRVLIRDDQLMRNLSRGGGVDALNICANGSC